MLFRLVRPLKRPNSSYPYFVQRIPGDLRKRAVGTVLAIPIGDEVVLKTISVKADSVRVSLRCREPSEVKVRQADISGYLETVWQALRADAPVPLSQRQAVALSGLLYRSWVDEDKGRTTAIEFTHDGEWVRIDVETPEEREAYWDALAVRWEEVVRADDPEVLEEPLGALIDRLLREKGIGAVDHQSRLFLLSAFARAMRDAFATRSRNAGGDYSPDPNSERFPEWKTPETTAPQAAALVGTVSLKGLVEDWWKEGQATGLALSTYESYRNTMARFVAYLRHDDARQVMVDDVIGFKDRRLTEINRRTGKPVSPKTIKDSDLAGLRAIFNWAVANRRISANPAQGVTIKLGKQVRTRSKGFTDEEAKALLSHSLNHQRGNERPKTFAAKRWTAWLCAYTGARLGEIVQLRKEDIRQEGDTWVIKLTPEAGTIKNKEARDVPVHTHLVELGFIAFVQASSDGYLFLKPQADGDIRGVWRGMKNRMAEFAREVVTDPAVAPNHGWRHLFKTIGIEAGIQERVLDAICGHAPKTVGASYGEVTVKAKADALALFPRFEVEGA